jgi:demethylmenaquinone methyltransferase/2-methoxy-6-polyprenyl-1,4-benzoquinol methylase
MGTKDSDGVRGSRRVAPDLEPLRVSDRFDRSASTYDRVNTIITLGFDARWRRWAARQATPRDAGGPPRVLDAGAGTGLLALDLARRGAAVTAADAAPRMLAVARDRFAAAGLPLRAFVADLSDPATAGKLDGPFEAITLGFGLRYFADPVALLRLLRGLLVPGGRLVVVEAVQAPQDLLGTAAGLYFFQVAPRLGAALSGRGELYDLLSASTRALGSADDVAAHLNAAGFAVAARRRFALGVVAGFVARPV